jgi:large subunit ribosomal protein L15
MPKLKGFNNLNRTLQVVNVDRLNTFEENEEIDVMRLFEKKLISNKDQPVKILGNGDLTKKLVVKADRISASAKEKIEKAKGSAIELMAKTEQPAV